MTPHVWSIPRLKSPRPTPNVLDLPRRHAQFDLMIGNSSLFHKPARARLDEFTVEFYRYGCFPEKQSRGQEASADCCITHRPFNMEQSQQQPDGLTEVFSFSFGKCVPSSSLPPSLLLQVPACLPSFLPACLPPASYLRSFRRRPPLFFPFSLPSSPSLWVNIAGESMWWGNRNCALSLSGPL